MSSDPRVNEYRRAAERMRHGRFDVEIPNGHDEIGRLGQSLAKLAQSLETRFDEIAKLARITERVNAGLVLDDVLAEVYESFRQVIPYERIGLALLEDGGRVVRARWAQSDAGEIKLGRGYAAPMAGSSLEQIIASGKPRILNDLESYLDRHPDSDSTRLIVAEGLRSSLTCPLVALGRPIGFMFFSSREKNTYREVHQGYFMQVAAHVSVILEKSRLYEEALDLNRRLRETQAALRHEASHDALTGVWNRRAVLRLLAREIARAQRDDVALAALIIDIDFFKPVNDEHGHLVGDEVLRELSRRLVSSLRTAEFFGRLGGEEFLTILCPGSEDTARTVMERARSVCAEAPFETSAGDLDITISLGAAVAERLDDVSISGILSAADRALYRAKQGGRNRWEIEQIESPLPDVAVRSGQRG